MKVIYIGFSHAISPWVIGSTIIADSEKQPYSHSYIRAIDPETGLWMVYQASHGMVNTMPFDNFKTVNIVVKEYKLTPIDVIYNKMIWFCKTNLGVPYSRLQLVFIAIKKLLHKELNINNKDSAFICSEFAAKVCLCAGIEIDGNLDYETPSDLDHTLAKNNIPSYNGEYIG